MITTLLLGQTGNQMFQYAAGRVLAEKHRVPLQIYMWQAADYRLHHFHVAGKTIFDYPPTALKRFFPTQRHGPAGRLSRNVEWCSRMVRIAKRKITGQATLNEWESPDNEWLSPDPESHLGAKNHVLLLGHWQKHEYYEPIAAQLAREFTVNTQPNAANRDMLRRIRASETAVAVHVRRGDYLESSHHFVCHPDYYRAAFRQLGEALTNPVFFIFSDNIPWTRRHVLPPGETHYVDINGPLQAHEDMRLMRACSHFVIANSTFSWWPAWLAEARDKIVIAPKAWHTPEVDARVDLGKHCPPHWVRI